MISIKSLLDAMPPELQRKSSLHTLRLTVEKYNATPDPLREAARYAMQRMETIRETNPEIALDDDIERLRTALDSANDERMHHYQRGRTSITGLRLKLE